MRKKTVTITELIEDAKNGILGRITSEDHKGIRTHRDQDGKTVLMSAASGGKNNVLTTLLDEKSAFRAEFESIINVSTTKTDRTAIYFAAQSGHTDCAKTLVKAGANPAVVSKDGVSPLLVASQNGYHLLVDYLVGDDNPKKDDVKRTIDTQWGENGATAAFQSAMKNQLLCLKSLVNKGNARLDITTNGGETPLLVATRRGHAPIITFLLSDNNPKRDQVVNSINQTGATGTTALYHAASYGLLGEVIALMKAGSSYGPCNDGTTPLWVASQNGHYTVAEYFLSDNNPKKDDVKRTMNASWKEKDTTAAFQAAANVHLPCLQLLAKAGADLGKLSSTYGTPLVVAIRKDQGTVINYLVDANNPALESVKATINQCVKENETAIVLAARKNNLLLVKRLLELGASLQQVAANTVLQFALTNREFKFAATLLLLGAIPTTESAELIISDKRNVTDAIVEQAVELKGHEKLCREFLEKVGVAVDQDNKKINSVLNGVFFKARIFGLGAHLGDKNSCVYRLQELDRTLKKALPSEAKNDDVTNDDNVTTEAVANSTGEQKEMQPFFKH